MNSLLFDCEFPKEGPSCCVCIYITPALALSPGPDAEGALYGFMAE